jgi:voltage-gated potassium channel
VNQEQQLTGWRLRLHQIIFEAETPTGKLFDVVLIISILASVGVVMLDSVDSFRVQYGRFLTVVEWVFTILFTVEYILRICSVRKPLKYIFSFYGIVDLLSILPAYIGLFIVGTHYLTAIRILRVCRIFRVLKFSQYVGEANVLMQALIASRRKVTVFLFGVLSIVVILGSVMHVMEGPKNGFTSIPRSVYWAIVTMTTVGYGDISPKTTAGQTLASLIMLLGYAIIAIPTGIVTAEMVSKKDEVVSTEACPECSADGHDADAKHCKYCGSILN